ncbi:hypothetical protein H4219_005529, partial [Mycoemilia scoparia]
ARKLSKENPKKSKTAEPNNTATVSSSDNIKNNGASKESKRKSRCGSYNTFIHYIQQNGQYSRNQAYDLVRETQYYLAVFKKATYNNKRSCNCECNRVVGFTVNNNRTFNPAPENTSANTTELLNIPSTDKNILLAFEEAVQQQQQQRDSRKTHLPPVACVANQMVEMARRIMEKFDEISKNGQKEEGSSSGDFLTLKEVKEMEESKLEQIVKERAEYMAKNLSKPDDAREVANSFETDPYHPPDAAPAAHSNESDSHNVSISSSPTYSSSSHQINTRSRSNKLQIRSERQRLFKKLLIKAISQVENNKCHGGEKKFKKKPNSNSNSNSNSNTNP